MNELLIILSCTWKFALTFPVAVYGMQMSFSQTLIFTNIGGITGVIFFTLLSNGLIRFWQNKVVPKFNFTRKNKPVFTKKRRMFVRIKSKYGLLGIVILNPIILSIPISAFLVSKYYGKAKINLLWLILGQFGWSLIYTYFYIFIKKAI